MTKAKQNTYGVSFVLKLDIGFEIKAESMAEAVEKAQALSVSDIVDFQANGWDHNDSEKPSLRSVYDCSRL